MGWFEKAGLSRGDLSLGTVPMLPWESKRRRRFSPVAGDDAELPPSHLLRELELLRPAVVVPVSELAIRELPETTHLSKTVGETVTRDGLVYVPLPHPSGASTWLNGPENKERLARALAALKEQAVAWRPDREREL